MRAALAVVAVALPLAGKAGESAAASDAAAVALAAALDAAAVALSDGTSIRSDDRSRLDGLDAAAGAAIRQALAGGAVEDVAVLTEALAGQPRPVAPEALAGDWSCRVVKAGGLVPLAVYDVFTCRISTDGDTVRFSKTGGSQRVRGTIHRDGDRLVLLGVGFVAGDTPPAYAALPAVIDPAATPQITSAPGVIEMTSPDRGRILFPFPMLESVLDVLVLER